jgi:hypothetical protein
MKGMKRAIVGGLAALVIALAPGCKKVPLEGREHLPPELSKKDLVEYSISTKGTVNEIALLKGEDYKITKKDDKIIVEGRVSYCIEDRCLDNPTCNPWFGCDTRYGKLTFE